MTNSLQNVYFYSPWGAVVCTCSLQAARKMKNHIENFLGEDKGGANAESWVFL